MTETAVTAQPRKSLGHLIFNRFDRNSQFLSNLGIRVPVALAHQKYIAALLR